MTPCGLLTVLEGLQPQEGQHRDPQGIEPRAGAPLAHVSVWYQQQPAGAAPWLPPLEGVCTFPIAALPTIPYCSQPVGHLTACSVSVGIVFTLPDEASSAGPALSGCSVGVRS